MISGFLIILFLENFSFQVMIAPLTPALPPWGAGAYCDASALLPKLEIFHDYIQVIRHNRNGGMP
jgi:hypothetical protein